MGSTDSKYKVFFGEIRKFQKKQNEQKQRGMNNYNILTTVLKASDEVRLHSRMIASLLDPNGSHYQNTLFLEKFLEVLDFEDFELNLSNTEVYVEYKDIDLYITDGVKHIIVENKIWAKDQVCQVIKYINIIKNEFDVQVDDNEIPNMRVVYLSARDKEVPDEHEVDNGYITFNGGKDRLQECSKKENTKKYVPDGLKNYKVVYRKISYKKDVLIWLENSKHEVQNITNLNEAIKQYIDVVKMINNEYKGNIMGLSDELKKDKNFKIAYDVSQEFDKTCATLESDFWNNLMENIKGFDGYIGIENKIDKSIKKRGLDTSIVKKIRAASSAILSEINLHFKISEHIMLMIGTDNNKGYIYCVVYKNNWGKISKDNDSMLVKSINNLLGYGFEKKTWCYAAAILNDTINLRNEKLISASKEIDNLTRQVEELIEKLEKINQNVAI